VCVLAFRLFVFVVFVLSFFFFNVPATPVTSTPSPPAARPISRPGQPPPPLHRHVLQEPFVCVFVCWWGCGWGCGGGGRGECGVCVGGGECVEGGSEEGVEVCGRMKRKWKEGEGGE